MTVPSLSMLSVQFVRARSVMLYSLVMDPKHCCKFAFFTSFFSWPSHFQNGEGLASQSSSHFLHFLSIPFLLHIQSNLGSIFHRVHVGPQNPPLWAFLSCPFRDRKWCRVRCPWRKLLMWAWWFSSWGGFCTWQAWCSGSRRHCCEGWVAGSTPLLAHRETCSIWCESQAVWGNMGSGAPWVICQAKQVGLLLQFRDKRLCLLICIPGSLGCGEKVKQRHLLIVEKCYDI